MKDLSSQVQSVIHPMALDLNRSLLEVFAYIRPPYSLMEGERYEVDLQSQRLKILYDELACYESEVQVIATFNREQGTWLWPSNNSSIPSSAYKRLFDVLSSLPSCQSYLAEGKFLINETSVFPFAAWLAKQASYSGMYPAMFDSNLYVLLALGNWVALNGYQLLELSCGFCFSPKHLCEKIIRISAKVGICKQCVSTLADVAMGSTGLSNLASIADKFEKTPQTNDTHPTYPCVACGSHAARIFGSEASLCYQCLSQCGNALGLAQE